jgi:site-specific recombinase XerD
MSSVTIVFRKDKLNKKNEAPIHFRIIKHRKISYIATGYSVQENEWDESNKRIKSIGKGRDHKETVAKMNAVISKRYSEIQKEVIELDSTKRQVTSKQVKDIVFGKKPQDFFPFAKSIVDTYKTDNKSGTYSRTSSVIAKMEVYAPNLSFHDITPKFLSEYEQYLKTEKGNSINTVHANFKFIRLVFNRAFEMDVIEHSLNPFLKYKMKTEKTQREYLTEEELEAFNNVETDLGTRMDLHKDMFVFSAYAAGLRVSDMLQLQWKNFDGTSINFTIKKTGNQLSIKIPNKGLAILEKYKLANSKSNDYIFNMLPTNTFLLSAKEIDDAISSANAYINKNIKLIAKKADIEKNISFHIARHTWATRALRKGISIDKVSKLMGHAAIKETQVYAKIINSELDKAMDAFND